MRGDLTGKGRWPCVVTWTWHVAFAVACVAVPWAFGGPRDVVVFKGIGRDLSRYDLRATVVNQDTIDGSFAAKVAAARLFYVGQAAASAVGDSVFAEPKRRAAVKALLAAGGTVFIDYNSTENSHIQEFLGELGVRPPGAPKGEYYACVPNPHSESTLLRSPHKLKGTVARAYGWWTDWPKEYDAPFIHEKDATRAAMLVRTGVAGKGAIILSRMFSVFRDSEGLDDPNRDVAENVLSSVFGDVSAPGRTTAVYDPYESHAPGVNVLFLATSQRCRWHVPTATVRVPFLVGEPIGMKRCTAPVRLSLALPAGVSPGSIRIVTPWGEVLTSQVVAGPGGGEGTVVVFEIDLAPYETRLLFCYWGGPPAPAEDAPPGFVCAERDNTFVLHNDKLHIVLYKKHPSIGLIRPTGSNTRNELADWDTMAIGKGNWLRNDGWQWAGAIAEDGPVRKQVRYTCAEAGLAVTYTLYAGTGALFYAIESKEGRGVTRFTGWAPFGDGIKDTLCYEVANGVKKLQLKACRFYRPYGRIDPYIKEGWIAIEDERGEAVGELFDPARVGKLTAYQHMTHGNTTVIGTRIGGGSATGAFLAGFGGYDLVRQAYIGWRNAPVVAIGTPQPKADMPDLATPRFGEQFLLVQGGLNRTHECTLSTVEARAEAVLTEIEKLGGNVVLGSAGDPEMLSAIIPCARQRGMGVWADPGLPRKKPCPVAERQVYVEAAHKAAQFDIDGLYILDEYRFRPGSPESRTAFRRTYGLDTPETMDFARLAEPAYHDLIVYQMDTVSDLVRDMVMAARAERPGLLTFMVTSPNNHFRLDGYHDLERQSEWLTTTCSDLYSTDLSYVRYMMKCMRGAQGNHKPVLSVNGCLYTPRDTAVNAKMHLLAGSNAMWYFNLDFLVTRMDVTEANAKVFRWVHQTGLGDILARCRPARYVAVLRDRDAFLDSIRRGESTGNLTAYERRIQKLCQLRNVPTDILFSKYLTGEELATYRVLIVPSDHVLSEERAQVIAGYVRSGGAVIVAGEALHNPVLAELCGVTAEAGEPVKAARIKGTASPLDGLDREVASLLVPVTPREGTAVLATVDGKPGATVVAAGTGTGKGRAVCVALTDMPPELAKNLVLWLGGRRPLEFPDDLEEQLESNVLTDGRHHVLALYNPHYSERRTGVLDVSDLVSGDGAVVTDFGTGTQMPCTGTVAVDIAPDSFAFLMIASAQDSPHPVASPHPIVQSPAYAATGGMTFLRVEPEVKVSDADRKKAPDHIYVGIFKTDVASPSGVDMGAEAMLAALKQQKQLRLVPEFIHDVEPKTLAFYDVVVLPNMNKRPENMSEDWQKVLHDYVQNGGGALLIHHTTGYPSTTPPVFPDIATCPDYVPIQTMQVTADHPVTSGASIRRRFREEAKDPAFGAYLRATQLAVGQEFQCGFADYIKLVPGTAGTTVVRSAFRNGQGGDPTVVVGSVGKGRVVLSGMDIGCRSTKPDGKTYHFEEHISKGEFAILLNAIFWLAER